MGLPAGPTPAPSPDPSTSCGQSGRPRTVTLRPPLLVKEAQSQRREEGEEEQQSHQCPEESSLPL